MSFVAAAAMVVGGVMQYAQADKARNDANRKRRRAEARVAELEANRQEIINPYAEAMQTLSNPYANLQVSTQAAEMRGEQTDIALASSLDTLRATGASAGGATALAQAAARSKQGIAADIAKQEAQNIQLRAQGQAQLEKQLATMSAAGSQFTFQAQEAREMQQLNRESSLMSSYSQQAAAYQGQAMAGLGTAIGGVAKIGGEIEWGEGKEAEIEYDQYGNPILKNLFNDISTVSTEHTGVIS
tara:strand:+ start:6073 stop:6801 length:729 start_codon:yes stop_codon:yes gene_type:complete